MREKIDYNRRFKIYMPGSRTGFEWDIVSIAIFFDNRQISDRLA